MKFFISLLGALFFVMVFVLPSMAQDKPRMTLQKALNHAYVNNPALRAARAELLSVSEALPQALSGWQPTVTSDLNVTSSDTDGSNFGQGGGGTGSTSKDVLLSLDQPVYRGGKTTAETNAARYTIAAQLSLLKAAEQEILRDAATAYMNVQRDEALLRLAENNREVIAKQLEASKDRFEVGELTRTDVSQAQARLADAEANIITARGDMRSSYAAFEQVVGLTPRALKVPEIALNLPDDPEEAVDLALQQSPRLLAAFDSHRAAEKDVDGIWAELLPEVGFFTSWNKVYDPQPGLIDEQTTKSVGLSASIPLYQAGNVRSRVRQAKHDANQRYLEILDTKRQIRQEAVQNWESLAAARAEIRSRLAQVEASNVAQEGVKAETEVGARTVLDALDADQELLDAQVALVTAQRNEVVASFDLAATLGFLSPQRLGFAQDSIVFNDILDDKALFDLNMDVDRVEKTD